MKTIYLVHVSGLGDKFQAAKKVCLKHGGVYAASPMHSGTKPSGWFPPSYAFGSEEDARLAEEEIRQLTPPT